MTTGAIIAIVVVAIILIALVLMIPRMRARAVEQKRRRELENRRSAEAERHRTEAGERERRAEMAEQKARMAQQTAERERADARLHEERATMHERGMADDELIADDEREEFAGVAGTGTDTTDEREFDRDRTTAADEPGTMRSGVVDDERAADQNGRADESRFQREKREDRIER